MQQEERSANDLAVERNNLAIDRTVMGADRSMMAWMRTALSLISFGFTIYKFLQATIKVEAVEQLIIKAQSPRRFGLTLIALGVISVFLGSMEYLAIINRMNKISTRKYSPFSFSFIVGMIIGLLGLVLFITILINKELF